MGINIRNLFKKKNKYHLNPFEVRNYLHLDKKTNVKNLGYCFPIKFSNYTGKLDENQSNKCLIEEDYKEYLIILFKLASLSLDLPELNGKTLNIPDYNDNVIEIHNEKTNAYIELPNWFKNYEINLHLNDDSTLNCGICKNINISLLSSFDKPIREINIQNKDYIFDKLRLTSTSRFKLNTLNNKDKKLVGKDLIYIKSGVINYNNIENIKAFNISLEDVEFDGPVEINSSHELFIYNRMCNYRDNIINSNNIIIKNEKYDYNVCILGKVNCNKLYGRIKNHYKSDDILKIEIDELTADHIDIDFAEGVTDYSNSQLSSLERSELYIKNIKLLNDKLKLYFPVINHIGRIFMPKIILPKEIESKIEWKVNCSKDLTLELIKQKVKWI